MKTDNNKPENPSAFPGQYSNSQGTIIPFPGMTLRDYFAGKVIASTLSVVQTESFITRKDIVEKFAQEAYLIADAMLAARDENEQEARRVKAEEAYKLYLDQACPDCNKKNSECECQPF